LGIKSLIIDPKGSVYPILQEFLPNIQIFNFGRESVAPGRCNIIECPDWMNVQTHVNMVENILLSVWQVFPPMNMIIHRALTNLFSKDGWSLRENKHGENRTLRDFKQEVLEVQKSMGYSKDTHLDISSAMEMRLNYFTQGQIGYQINCQRSTPIEDLLQKTTIINLQHADNYAEKVVALTFLARLFEYFKKLPTTDKLQTYLIVDEAEHYFGVDQLIAYDDYEKAAAGKAATKKLIEMISQSRAYGLGICISTQSPSKMPREIMVNCNTKIIHKMIDGQDISYLQNSMRLTEKQADMLPALKVGEAMVIDPNNHYPFKLKINLPVGLENAGKGLQTDFIEDLMINQMRDYFLQNEELYNNTEEEEEEEKERTHSDVDKLIEQYLPRESYLTEDDLELQESKAFKELFNRTLKQVYDNDTEKYSEEYRILFFSKFMEEIRQQLTYGEKKEAVLEFFIKGFDLHFNSTPESRWKIVNRIIAIIRSWEK